MNIFDIVFKFLIENYALYVVLMGSIITAIIMLTINYAKKPLKILTTQKIPNKEMRQLVNTAVIAVVAMGLSFGLWFLLNWIAPQYFAVRYFLIVLTGMSPIYMYAVAEGYISHVKAQKLLGDLIEKGADGELDKEEIKDTANKAFEALNPEIDAEQELQELLKK